MRHREIHERDQKDQREQKARAQFFRFVDDMRDFFRHPCARGRIRCDARPVTERFHRAHDLLFVYDVFVEFRAHALPHQADFRDANALHFADGFLDPRRAGGASHAADIELLFRHTVINPV